MPKVLRASKEPRNIVGQNVRAARHSTNPPLTQDQLSGKLAHLGVQLDRVALAKVESGMRCAFDFEVKALAEALNVSVGWLLDAEEGAQRNAVPRGKPKL